MYKNRKMNEIILGLLVAVAMIVLTVLLNKYFATKLIAATILVAIAFIYVGFALKENTVPIIVFEIMVAVLFYFMALIGYSGKSSLIAFGIILHGFWDIFHHKALIVATDISGYWPSFCLTIDLVYGAYLLYIFKKSSARN